MQFCISFEPIFNPVFKHPLKTELSKYVPLPFSFYKKGFEGVLCISSLLCRIRNSIIQRPGFLLTILMVILFSGFSQNSFSQHYTISGKIFDEASNEPINNVTVHLLNLPVTVLSKEDGSFSITTDTWSDSLELTSVGYQRLVFPLQKNHSKGLVLKMKTSEQGLQEVVIVGAQRDKEPGKRYMKKVIANKIYNNPDRFQNYSYKQYLRHEVDINNIDSSTNGKGLKSFVLKIYHNAGEENAGSRLLPIYFSETVSDKYHNTSPSVNKENIIATKTLGLETDKFLRQLDKFNFSYNIYDNWYTIFNQTYASPLSNTAFNYYNFYFNDSNMVDGKKVYTIRFKPKQKYENAFSGSLWINDSTFSVKKIEMHLSNTANLDFIKNVRYSEEFRLSPDSATGKLEYMPYKFISHVEFETGIELLGIPAPTSSKKVRLEVVNTTVIGNIKINSGMAKEFLKKMKKEANDDLQKPDSYWENNRLGESLSNHEKSIYVMVDSLKNSPRFVFGSKVINLLGTGFWDFDNKIRIGPYYSLLSTNSIEGYRFRSGLWTLGGFNKKINLNGYFAYGTKDQSAKGGLGIKFLWNAAKWTKTTLYASSDYDYLTDEDQELDEDNLINSYFRKDIPTTKIYLRQVELKHEQYVSKKLSINGSFIYKQLTPVFDFSFHPIDSKTRSPIDSVNVHALPAAEASIGLRFVARERTVIWNFDQVRANTYDPILTANFTQGFKMGNTSFGYQKVSVGIEQLLRLPPKSLFYYNIHAGKTFGTAPYLLLNLPAGNEYYVASRYLFNTMLPYEFAADEYVSLYSRLYFGGLILNKIPFIRKLGWRTRISYNAYQGDMSQANREYNKDAHFKVPDRPFMEAGVGIENIFHVFSVDYYKRLSGLNNSKKENGAVFLGVNITF